MLRVLSGPVVHGDWALEPSARFGGEGIPSSEDKGTLWTACSVDTPVLQENLGRVVFDTSWTVVPLWIESDSLWIDPRGSSKPCVSTVGRHHST
jgi:hypothetical protein